MKNFHQNLLIVLALSLCGLCVYQWYSQTLQRNRIQQLNQMVYGKSEAIQGYTNTIRNLDRQLAQMDQRLTELRAAAKTNEELIVAKKQELNRMETANEALTNQAAEYKRGVETLQSKLKEAYAGIQKQNEALKELVAQRDEFVKKYNDEVKDRNNVVSNYNDLAARVEKLQGGGKR